MKENIIEGGTNTVEALPIQIPPLNRYNALIVSECVLFLWLHSMIGTERNSEKKVKLLRVLEMMNSQYSVIKNTV